MCLFNADNVTLWVLRKYERKLKQYVVEEGKAPTEHVFAPCAVRKGAPTSMEMACELLKKLSVETLTVVQYGQKAPFGSKVVQWALQHVRGEYERDDRW